MRLFVAVRPPPEVVERLRLLARPELPAVRWTGPSQWHVTLRFLGDVAHEVAPLIAAALDAAPLPLPARAVLGPSVDRFGDRVLHVPVSGLDDLAGAVAEATRGVGGAGDDRPFRGHLTLARARPHAGGRRLRSRHAAARGAAADPARVPATFASLAGVAVGGEWDVDAVTLVASRLGPGGPTYEDVHRSSPAPR